MKSLFQTLEAQLSARSKREKILLFIALFLGIYLCFFHSFLKNTLEQITQLRQNIQQSQIYLQSNKTQNIAKDLFNVQQLNLKLTTLIQTLNSQSLPIFAILKKLNDYALTHKIALWEADTKEESSFYQISLVGNASLENLFSFLDFIENLPLIHLLSFEILKNGDFKLTLKNHPISLMPPPNTPLSPKLVLQQIRQTLQKEQLIFSFFNPSYESKLPKQSIFELEALFNQKAKINGKWLKKGETIQGYKLTKIYNNQVILQANDAFIQLQLKDHQVFQ